jgi:hypothetical protein
MFLKLTVYTLQCYVCSRLVVSSQEYQRCLNVTSHERCFRPACSRTQKTKRQCFRPFGRVLMLGMLEGICNSDIMLISALWVWCPEHNNLV